MVGPTVGAGTGAGVGDDREEDRWAAAGVAASSTPPRSEVKSLKFGRVMSVPRGWLFLKLRANAISDPAKVW